jgi:hypothetical protein
LRGHGPRLQQSKTCWQLIRPLPKSDSLIRIPSQFV